MKELLLQTPTWVYLLFVALLIIGFSQTATRRQPLLIPFLLPVAMSVYSLIDTILHFSAGGRGIALAVVAATCAWGFMRKYLSPKGVSYLPEVKRFEIKGSYLPLTVILCIFSVKYIHGALSALYPPITERIFFTTVFATFNGLFFGFFLSRVFLFIDAYRQATVLQKRKKLLYS